jgi:hypothetical protein
MELAILAGMGLVGYYLNKNEDLSNKDNKRSKILTNDIPNGFDIYNQNRLDVCEEKQRDLSKISFEKSQYPTKTNIIPSYYNQLSPLLNKTKFNDNIKYDKIDVLYDVQDDLDDIYSDMPYMRTSKPNEHNDIYRQNTFDRDSLFLGDEYEQFDFKVRQPPVKLPGVARQAYRSPTKPKGPPEITSEAKIDVIENYKGIEDPRDGSLYTGPPDTSLLSVSEGLTDNASAIRRILSEGTKGKSSSSCKRRQTPMDLVRSKKLIGVTPGNKSVIVDGAVADYPAKPSKVLKNIKFKYPTFHKDKSQTDPPAEYPSYLAQFEVQTFDSDGLPSAPNDVYQTNDKTKLAEMERDLSFKGGWTQYDQNQSMSYGIVPDDQLVHDNMVPYYSPKYGYGSNDLQNEHVMNFKNELFTGNLKSTWNKKDEVRPFFTPVADLSFVYGTPVRPEGEESRFIPSRYRNGELLFDPIRVTPGLNLGYNEIGTQGYQDLFRSLPKTVDELRIRTDQKITYEGRIIPGLKGNERPIQAPVISYKPDGFKITTEADLLPTTDVNTGPKVRENFIMKETDRAGQHIEYTGGAYTTEEAVGRNVPEWMREKYKYATKQNFTLPKPLQKFAKGETAFNPNLNSYDIQFNARSQTGQNDYISNAGNVTGSKTYADLQDEAKNTLKQITSAIPYNVGAAAPNTMRGTAFPMDVARPTMKSIIAETELNPNAPNLATQQRVYYSDVAKQTIKETTIDQIAPSNVVQDNKTYANWTDNAKMTMKEIIAEIPQTITQIFAVGQAQGQVPLQDIAKTTIKEGTVQIPYQTVVTPVNQQQGQVPLQDIAKTTIKEGTVQIPYQTVVTAVEQQQGQASGFNRKPLRTTIKEGTVQIPYETFVTAVNQQQGQVPLQDIAKNTIKEITVQTPWNNFVTPVNQQQGQVPLQDIARTTIREGTVQIPYQTVVTGVDQQQGQANSFNRFPLRTTIKEGTVQIPYQTVVTGVDQQQGQASGFNRKPLRTTIKEGTVQIPYQTVITGVDQQQGQASGFNRTPLRTTIKEGTVQIPYQTVVTAVEQQQGQASGFNRKPLRTTIKEGTVQIPYQTVVTGVDQQQGQASGFNRTPLRNTIKETTIDNDYIGGPTNDVYAKGYGYMAESMFAPNTNRQFTSQEVYVPGPKGDDKARLYNDAYNASIDDRKELLSWYRPPTACGVDLGPIKEQMNVFLKNDDNRMPGPNPVYSVNNNLDRPMPQGSTRSYEQVPLNLFIDPLILKQLNANPYNIPYYGRHYEQ